MGSIRNESGVSVIVGTLLLILITVVAASGLALMVSQMQKDEMNRQTHVAAVKNEKVEITGVFFKSSPDEWDRLFLIPNTTSNQSYSAVTFSLTNLNTDEVKVIAITVNDQPVHNFTAITNTVPPRYTPYNFSSQDPSAFITVPAGGRQQIRINITSDFFSIPQHLGQSDQITIRVMTSLYNTFEKTIKPPKSVIQYTSDTADIGTIKRDTMVFDGSGSSAAEGATITNWNWTIMDASSTNTDSILDPIGNCTDSENLKPVDNAHRYYATEIVRLNPSSIGPFCANLTVQDSNGMSATSDYLHIPANPQIEPPASINYKFEDPMVRDPSYPTRLNVTVIDVGGHPVSGLTVNYIIGTNQFGNLTMDNYVGTTVNGYNQTNVTCGVGSIKIAAGNLQPIEISAKSAGSCWP